jgi:hypothetical protein
MIKAGKCPWRKLLPLHLRTIDQSLFPFVYIANPIVPNAKPATDAAQEKKFKKNVDSRTLIIIRKGKTMPNSIRNTPSPRRNRGEFIKFVLIARIILN